MKTLLLDNTLWDLCRDAAGNIAVASDPYQRAQSVANAIKLFAAELWYDDSKGVPYFTQILGHAPPPQVFRDYMTAAAETVPGVVNATCVIDSIAGRTLTGSVSWPGPNGTTETVAFP